MLQFDKIESASGKNNSFTNLKINDDEGNDFGQERAGTQSVNAATTLHLNWNASTTPSKAVRYFRHVMNDGPISRLTLATIPDPGIGADMPVLATMMTAMMHSSSPISIILMQPQDKLTAVKLVK